MTKEEFKNLKAGDTIIRSGHNPGFVYSKGTSLKVLHVIGFDSNGEYQIQVSGFSNYARGETKGIISIFFAERYDLPSPDQQFLQSLY